MNPYGMAVPCIPTAPINPALINTKRMSRQKNFERPDKTATDEINENEELKREKLENYLAVDNIDFVSINTHVRYEIFDLKNGANAYKFRLGGLLAKKDTNFVVLSNGQLTWSVPKVVVFNGENKPTKFYRILTPYEKQLKCEEELQKERDQQRLVAETKAQELELQKQEIERLKKVIYKMSEGSGVSSQQSQLNSGSSHRDNSHKDSSHRDNSHKDSSSYVSNSNQSNGKRSLGANVVRNVRKS